jgi:hypothetical protein
VAALLAEMFHGGRFCALAPYLFSFVTRESCQKRLCHAHAFPSAVQAEARLQGRVSQGKFNTMALACRGMVLVGERESRNSGSLRCTVMPA